MLGTGTAAAAAAAATNALASPAMVHCRAHVPLHFRQFFLSTSLETTQRM